MQEGRRYESVPLLVGSYGQGIHAQRCAAKKAKSQDVAQYENCNTALDNRPSHGRQPIGVHDLNAPWPIGLDTLRALETHGRANHAFGADSLATSCARHSRVTIGMPVTLFH